MSNTADTSYEVFDQISKNMKYGAPELKKLYQKFVTRGLIVATLLATILSVTSLALVLWDKGKDNSESENLNREVTLADLDVPPPIDEVPPEIKEVALKDLAALTPEPVAKKLVTEEIKLKSQKELEEVKLPVASEGTDDPSKVTATEFSGKVVEKKIEEKVEKKEEKKKEIFQQFEVEKAPVAVNLGSVKSSMRYPEIARQSGMEGRVVAKVLVGTDGSVIKVGGISGPNVFRDEVSDKVMNLQFTPALQSGQPVKCWVSVPFSFTLSSKDKRQSDDEDD